MKTTILIGNELFEIIFQENHIDPIYAIQPKENYNTAVRDEIFTLKQDLEKGFIFLCTQSAFSDNSGLDHGISGYHPTRGEAIKSALKYKFKIMIGSSEVSTGSVKFDINVQYKQLNLNL